jgi:hypothetical protein
LGEYKEFDLYFCMQGRLYIPTVLARYSDEVFGYSSGLTVADHIPQLAEAKRRAKERGLL